MPATRFGSPSIGAVLLHIEITDRKLVEERLYEQEERFRFALENSPVVVFNQDRELRYIWINSPVLGWRLQADRRVMLIGIGAVIMVQTRVEKCVHLWRQVRDCSQCSIRVVGTEELFRAAPPTWRKR